MISVLFSSQCHIALKNLRPSSRHPFTPPPLPPLPPPIDIPQNSEEIYATISETPRTATTLIASPDYEDGYILRLDSVPSKPAVG